MALGPCPTGAGGSTCSSCPKERQASSCLLRASSFISCACDPPTVVLPSSKSLGLFPPSVHFLLV